MKKKGFTLVELLAVITLLGLLGLIVVPIVTNTIENQRIKAFESSVHGLLDTVQAKSQNSDFDEMVYTFDVDKLYSCDDINTNCDTLSPINTSGKISNGEGFIKVDTNGYTTLSIKNDKYCAFKTAYSDLIVSEDMSYCNFGKAVGIAIDLSLKEENTKYEYFEIIDNILYAYDEDYNAIFVSDDDSFYYLTDGYIEYNDGYLYDLTISSDYFCATDYRASIVKFRTHSCTIRSSYNNSSY